MHHGIAPACCDCVVHELDPASWQAHIDLDLMTILRMTRAVLPEMDAVLCLASSRADFVTGQVIAIDGGSLL